MARRKKGRDISGWILVDKPAGITSSTVVNKLRWLFDANKAGHGGTLDPDATGLLPVALGEATKLLPFLDEAQKTYKFRVNWGAQTSTDDAAGDIIMTNDARPNLDEIEAVLPQFRGDILQTPPQVSAVKVDGQRAYDLARDGIVMELKQRPLHVASLEITDHTNDTADLLMSCGKGGYVRSIARDLGAQLGCLGHVDHLRRLACLGFTIDQAISYEALLTDHEDNVIIEIGETPLIDQIEVTPDQASDLKQGRVVNYENLSEIGEAVLAMCGNLPIAVVELTNDGLAVRRGLHMEQDALMLTKY